MRRIRLVVLALGAAVLAAALLILLRAPGDAAIAVGNEDAWSATQRGLRGRLWMQLDEDGPGLRYAVYIELDNSSDEPIAVNDPPEIEPELISADGKPVPLYDPDAAPTPVDRQTRLVPPQGRLNLRADAEPVDMPARGRICLAFGGRTWALPPGNYILRTDVTFKRQEGRTDQWPGRLRLPRVEFTVTKRDVSGKSKRPVILGRKDSDSVLGAAPGLPERTYDRLAAVARRRKEYLDNWHERRRRGEEFDPVEELDALCTTHELVTLTCAEDWWVHEAAFGLLRGARNSSLAASDVEALIGHLHGPPGKAMRAGSVLAQNRAIGLARLTKLLDSSRNPFVLVYVARALVESDAELDARVRAKAETLLLSLLSHEGDIGQTACNALSPLEAHLVEPLIGRLEAPNAPDSLRYHGLRLLAGCVHADPRDPEVAPTAHAETARALFLAALDDPLARVRSAGVHGLDALGLRRADEAIYTRIIADKADYVRESVYRAFTRVEEPWVIPFLMTGLDDEDVENKRYCAVDLARRKHAPAVPVLMRVLEQAPTDPDEPFGDFRGIAEAAVELAGLDDYDFRQVAECQAISAGYAMIIVDRDDVYRRECARLLEWWASAGSRRVWTGE